MNALEQEILAKISLLDTFQQSQVLAFVEGLEKPRLSLHDCLEMAQASLEETRSRYGTDYFVNSLSLLEEAREERSNDLLGGK